MVRLKEETNETESVKEEMFQFHNGSIKRMSLSIVEQHFKEFQFHNGSIKRHSLTVTHAPIFGFNSTMVRLKVDLT